MVAERWWVFDRPLMRDRLFECGLLLGLGFAAKAVFLAGDDGAATVVVNAIAATPAPNVVADIEPGTYAVTAVRPDGGEEDIEVSLSWADFVPGGFKLVCRAPGVARDALPPGTTLWLR